MGPAAHAIVIGHVEARWSGGEIGRDSLVRSRHALPIDLALRVSAVSYLNTWPLVWGFLYGPGKGIFDFQFDLPSRCADALATGEVDIGLVPCAELDRLGIDFLPHLGIACDGAVRSILLVSKVPFTDIKTVAADAGSRTSVALTRILLEARYGCRPEIRTRAPRMEAMLAECDAALIIGDPALHLDPDKLPWLTLDLGAEWKAWTGLPMVFAVWAGRREVLSPEVADAFTASYQWGRDRIERIVERAVSERGFPSDLARDYLTHHIIYELSERHLEGLNLFRQLAREAAHCHQAPAVGSQP